MPAIAEIWLIWIFVWAFGQVLVTGSNETSDLPLGGEVAQRPLPWQH